MPSTSQHSKKPSVVGTMLRIVVRIIGWLLLAWFVSLLISGVFIILKGRHAELIDLQQLVDFQLGYLAGQHLGITQHYFVDKMYGYLKILRQFFGQFVLSHNIQYTNYSLNKLLNTCIDQVNVYCQVVFISTSLTLLRITVIGLFLPLLVLLAAVGLTLGLVARYLRRIQGGRETSLIYHHARIAVIPTMLWSWLIFIALPCNIEPAYILMPASILFASLIYLTIKTFKKYI